MEFQKVFSWAFPRDASIFQGIGLSAEDFFGGGDTIGHCFHCSSCCFLENIRAKNLFALSRL